MRATRHDEIQNRWRESVDSRPREIFYVASIRHRVPDVAVQRVAALLYRLSDNKRRPEATDNTRFHKFFRTPPFYPL